MKKLLCSFLLSPDGVDTAAPVETPAPAPVGDPPPAATVVVTSEITEEVVKLRKKTADLERDKKSVEIQASNLRDENERLKKAGVTAAPVADKRSALEKFMETGETD